MRLFDIFSKKPKIENTSLQRILPRMKEWKKILSVYLQIGTVLYVESII